MTTPWADATIATFGDSITWYDGKPFGPSHSEAGVTAIGYQAYMRSQLGAAVTNLGVSGYAMREICDLIQITDFSPFDAVTITSGANDFKDGEPIGAMSPIGSSFNEGTFIGALQASIEHIQDVAPAVSIFLATPIKGWNSSGILMPTKWPQAILDAGELYALPVCDWYSESGIELATRDLYIGDLPGAGYKLHPTNAGFELMADVLIPFLRRFRHPRRGASVGAFL